MITVLKGRENRHRGIVALAEFAALLVSSVIDLSETWLALLFVSVVGAVLEGVFDLPEPGIVQVGKRLGVLGFWVSFSVCIFS